MRLLRLISLFETPSSKTADTNSPLQQMEQKVIAYGNRLPPLSANYPWLVAQNLDGTGDQTFYTIHEQLRRYQCLIPELLGRLIRGHSHGWVILSNNNKMWSLWNPVTSEIINLPPLTLSKSESVAQCCLSSPPDDPSSVLLLTITGKPTLVFCQLGFKRDRLRWTRMSYNRQLKGIICRYGGFLQCPTSYNGKVYALCDNGDFVIQVDTILKDGEVLIKLLSFGRCPDTSNNGFRISIPLLIGSCTELFYIKVAYKEVTKKTLGNVYLFKWVMTSMKWEEMVDSKDAVFYVDLARDYSVYYSHAIASGSGGYIHIRDGAGKMMYSFDVEDKTISVSIMAYPTSHVTLWESRLEGGHEDFELTLDFDKEEDKDNKIVVTSATNDEVELNKSHLLNLPSHLLEMLMDHCIGVEYLSFRATCKSCHLAAPLIQWSNETALRRLHKYSLVSPWLVVVDKNRSIINFTDPVFGDKYNMKRSLVLIHRDKILCSRFGWLLFRSEHSILLFFNPFTNDIRKLPPDRRCNSLCFSAPPTSPDCMVVGFSQVANETHFYIHFVARERTWHVMRLDFGGADPHGFCFPTFCGQDLYVLCDRGEVYVLKNLFKSQGYYHSKVANARSCGGEYFLVRRDQHILLVVVGEFGEYVEVFKLNDYTKDWEKIDSLGRYMICIGGTTCLCIEAKTPEMENKIFFPRLHSKNGKIVFYSLETCRYHRFDGKNIEEVVGVGRELVYPHAWIEPTWS